MCVSQNRCGRSWERLLTLLGIEPRFLGCPARYIVTLYLLMHLPLPGPGDGHALWLCEWEIGGQMDGKGCGRKQL